MSDVLSVEELIDMSVTFEFVTPVSMTSLSTLARKNQSMPFGSGLRHRPMATLDGIKMESSRAFTIGTYNTRHYRRKTFC